MNEGQEQIDNGQNSVLPSKNPPDFSEVPSEYMEVANAISFYETRKRYATQGFDIPEGGRWHMANLTTPNQKLQAYAQLQPDPEEIEPYLSDEQLAAWQKRMGEYVMAMSDLTADVLDMVSAIWILKAKHWAEPVKITADEFLQMRGLKEHKSGADRRGGYTDEQRKEIATQLAIMDNTWITILAMDVIDEVEGRKGLYRKMRKWEGRSRAVVVESVFGEVDHQKVFKPYVWDIKPGKVFAKFLFGPGRQTALLAQKALGYHTEQQKWEKRLTRYLAYQWRIRQRSGDYFYPFTVETLLKAIGVEIDAKNPIRTKERLEKAMNTLQQDKVIVAWRYFMANKAIIGKPGWRKEWLTWKIVVDPPQTIIEQYAKIKNSVTKKVKALPKDTEASFGEKLKQARLARGLTLMQAAEQIGIHYSRICRIEKGENPSADTVTKIQQWLAIA